ncbi:phage regulatory protein/antirepressor Ant [Acinetobacter bereziniae]|uniref:phage regulatory protein/antirepressor Ant n=1 Tax=Acinetobacter bereziniae TaxID=106648 RepID=UPI001250BE2B|nr:phage regulatory protein/antirepressor Ant [Acinetobacter bereziniae]
MNAIAFSVQAKQQILTMSTRLIAELTGKRHPDVKRDCEVMFAELNLDMSKFAHIYLDSMNRQQIEYLLPKDLVETLITGYSIKLRYQVIQRLHELENQSPKELSRLEILQIALHAEEEKQALQGQVQILEPKAQALDVLSNSYGTETLDCAAHSIGIQARKTLRPWMKENGWLHKDKDGNWRALGHRITAGHLIEVDRVYTDAQGFPQHTITVYITPKGKTVLTTSLIKAGMIKGDRHETAI